MRHGAGDSEAGQRARLRLQGDVLASDMAAFKAANSGGCLADFVRWHSPKDWLSDSPSGLPGRLSPRMSPEVRANLPFCFLGLGLLPMSRRPCGRVKTVHNDPSPQHLVSGQDRSPAPREGSTRQQCAFRLKATSNLALMYDSFGL